MKKIVCEICGGAAFVKKDGQFFCQGCGTAYSAEEVKGMMQEVEEAPAAAAKEASVPNQKLNNTLVMANSAFEAGKLAEADKYCGWIIDMDGTCAEAWFLKAKCAGWSASVDAPALEEAAKYFCVALNSAPEKNKAQMKQQAAIELCSIGISLLTHNTEAFAAEPNQFTLFEITENTDRVLKAYQTVMDCGSPVSVPVDIVAELSKVMNQAASAALENISKAWSSLENPGKQQFVAYKACQDHIDGLSDHVIQLCENNEGQAIAAYRNKISGIEKLISKKVYRQEKDPQTGETVFVALQPMSDLETMAKSMLSIKYSTTVSELEAKENARKAAEAKAAQEAKEQRIKAYWEAHAEEKAKLDKELETLEAQKKEYNAQIAELQTQIGEIKKDLNASVPQDAQIEALKNDIRNINKGRLGVGLFNFKGQKELNAKIEPLKTQKNTLEQQAKEARKRIKEDVKKRTEPLKEKVTALKSAFKAAENRQNEIRSILTKDPAENEA